MDLASHDLVIFDCDGVLVDSERLTVEVEARMLTELGWSMTPAEVVSRFMGRSLAWELQEITERLGAEAALVFERRLVPELTEVFAAELVPVEGLPVLLAVLAERGTSACVASSGTPEGIRTKLDLTGLRGHFCDRISSAVEVEHGKPAPDLFLLAASRMGAPPERCAVVEDSVPGVTAGVAAGMTVYGFAGGLSGPGDLAAAGATTFDRMANLPP
ncbi:MAG: HAD family hydrolase [Marmoricola sp.]